MFQFIARLKFKKVHIVLTGRIIKVSQSFVSWINGLFTGII